jgi:hypothetical protein
MLRDDPSGAGAPGNGPDNGGGAPAGGQPPAAPPAQPATFDPSSMTPEARAYMDARIRAEQEKARTTTRDNAAAEARRKLLEELSGGDANLTPEQLRQKLTEGDQHAQKLAAENRRLAAQLQIGSAARSAGADEQLVTAVLAHGGKLDALDPAAADFATKVATLVAEAITANPRLKIDSGPAVPPAAGQNPVGVHGAPNGGEGRKRPGSTAEALAAIYAKK